eukprot:m.853278 g.853278  ORF g.853278 m.853278 type:complete len:350 (-) comp23500_c0_seq9:3468-4517(-)
MFDAVQKDDSSFETYKSKRIVVHGKETEPQQNVETGSNVSMHFTAKVHLKAQHEGDLACGHRHTLLDDSRKLLSDPFELRIGKQFVVTGWEEAVKTMCVGEKSVFHFGPEIIPHYAQLATVLRKQFRERTGLAPPSHGHACCGANRKHLTEDADLQRALGHDLEVEFEILDIQPPGTFQRSRWELSWQEKVDAVASTKAAGNAAFKSGRFGDAANFYEDAIGSIESLQLASKAGELDESGVSIESAAALREPLLLNYALCMIKLKSYNDAIEHASIVITNNQACGKAWYLRGQARLEKGRDIADALSDLERAHALEPKSAKVQSLLQRCRRAAQQGDQQDRAMYSKMFA